MIRMTLLAACALLLAGCSSFKVGTMLYCPFGADCALQSVTPKAEAAVPPAPAASS